MQEMQIQEIQVQESQIQETQGSTAELEENKSLLPLGCGFLPTAWLEVGCSGVFLLSVLCSRQNQSWDKCHHLPFWNFKRKNTSLPYRNGREGNICQEKTEVLFCTRPSKTTKTISELARQRDRRGSFLGLVSSFYNKCIEIYKDHSCPSLNPPQFQQSCWSLCLQLGKCLRTTVIVPHHLSKIHLKKHFVDNWKPSPPAACAIHIPNPALVVWKWSHPRAAPHPQHPFGVHTDKYLFVDAKKRVWCTK